MLGHSSMTHRQIKSFIPQSGFSDLEETFFASEVQLDESEDYYKAPLLSRLATHIADLLDSGRLPVKQ